MVSPILTPNGVGRHERTKRKTIYLRDNANNVNSCFRYNSTFKLAGGVTIGQPAYRCLECTQRHPVHDARAA